MRILTTANQLLPLRPAGPAHADQAEHHAGEAGPEVRGPPSLRPRRLTQHRQDRGPHAAGRLPAARQRAHARRPAAVGAQLGSGGRSSASSQPPLQRLDPDPLPSLYELQIEKQKKI